MFQGFGRAAGAYIFISNLQVQSHLFTLEKEATLVENKG